MKGSEAQRPNKMTYGKPNIQTPLTYAASSVPQKVYATKSKPYDEHWAGRWAWFGGGVPCVRRRCASTFAPAPRVREATAEG